MNRKSRRSKGDRIHYKETVKIYGNRKLDNNYKISTPIEEDSKSKGDVFLRIASIVSILLVLLLYIIL